jgi:protein tyrosine phosphatase (PTP) superfamily phosphohydrolase (DUF442 family)
VRHERQDEQYAEAIAELTGPTGPLRFARVGAGLFRGGQPSHRHLALLHAIGVRTIVCLRREAAPAWRAEAAEAKRLGMRFLHFPWYGIFGARDALIDGVVAAMRDWSTGAVYVHCKRLEVDLGLSKIARGVRPHRAVAGRGRRSGAGAQP